MRCGRLDCATRMTPLCNSVFVDNQAFLYVYFISILFLLTMASIHFVCLFDLGVTTQEGTYVCPSLLDVPTPRERHFLDFTLAV